jgi:hypothetical protein
VRLAPGSRRNLYYQGVAAYRRGELPKAATAFRAALAARSAPPPPPPEPLLRAPVMRTLRDGSGGRRGSLRARARIRARIPPLTLICRGRGHARRARQVRFADRGGLRRLHGGAVPYCPRPHRRRPMTLKPAGLTVTCTHRPPGAAGLARIRGRLELRSLMRPISTHPDQ